MTKNVDLQISKTQLQTESKSIDMEQGISIRLLLCPARTITFNRSPKINQTKTHGVCYGTEYWPLAERTVLLENIALPERTYALISFK
jgi:hypothetical protein